MVSRIDSSINLSLVPSPLEGAQVTARHWQEQRQDCKSAQHSYDHRLAQIVSLLSSEISYELVMPAETHEYKV